MITHKKTARQGRFFKYRFSIYASIVFFSLPIAFFSS